MKEKVIIKLIEELDKETSPLLTAQIRINPFRSEALCYAHKDMVNFLARSCQINQKEIDKLVSDLIEEPMNQLNDAISKLISDALEKNMHIKEKISKGESNQILEIIVKKHEGDKYDSKN